MRGKRSNGHTASLPDMVSLVGTEHIEHLFDDMTENRCVTSDDCSRANRARLISDMIQDQARCPYFVI